MTKACFKGLWQIVKCIASWSACSHPGVYVHPTIDDRHSMSLNRRLMSKSRVIVSLLGAFLLSACAELLDLALLIGSEASQQEPYSNLSGSPDKVVTAGDTVVLVPVVEDNINLSVIDYEWRQLKGPSVRIEVLANGNARFVAPDVEAMDEVILGLCILAGGEPVQVDNYIVYVGALNP